MSGGAEQRHWTLPCQFKKLATAMNCKSRAEAFARSLRKRLRLLGRAAGDDANADGDEDETAVNHATMDTYGDGDDDDDTQRMFDGDSRPVVPPRRPANSQGHRDVDAVTNGCSARISDGGAITAATLPFCGAPSGGEDFSNVASASGSALDGCGNKPENSGNCSCAPLVTRQPQGSGATVTGARHAPLADCGHEALPNRTGGTAGACESRQGCLSEALGPSDSLCDGMDSYGTKEDHGLALPVYSSGWISPVPEQSVVPRDLAGATSTTRATEISDGAPWRPSEEATVVGRDITTDECEEQAQRAVSGFLDLPEDSGSGGDGAPAPPASCQCADSNDGITLCHEECPQDELAISRDWDISVNCIDQCLNGKSSACQRSTMASSSTLESETGDGLCGRGCGSEASALPDSLPQRSAGSVSETTKCDLVELLWNPAVMADEEGVTIPEGFLRSCPSPEGQVCLEEEEVEAGMDATRGGHHFGVLTDDDDGEYVATVDIVLTSVDQETWGADGGSGLANDDPDSGVIRSSLGPRGDKADNGLSLTCTQPWETRGDIALRETNKLCVSVDIDLANMFGFLGGGAEEGDPLSPTTPDVAPPRVQRSSSLKTVKTPPGTPNRKKIVRFADALGLDLEAVKTVFLDDLPTVPSSAYRDLDSSFCDGGGGSSAIAPFGGGQSPSAGRTVLVPEFQQPGSLSDFLERLRLQSVCLESAVATSDGNLLLVMRVLNLGFEKCVSVRYTSNEWLTHADLAAAYVEDSSDGFSDKFWTRLDVSSVQAGERLAFAVRYVTRGGYECWDNNGGRNYAFRCFVEQEQQVPPGDDSWIHFL